MAEAGLSAGVLPLVGGVNAPASLGEMEVRGKTTRSLTSKVMGGEVHCGTNTIRAARTAWWIKFSTTSDHVAVGVPMENARLAASHTRRCGRTGRGFHGHGVECAQRHRTAVRGDQAARAGRGTRTRLRTGQHRPCSGPRRHRSARPDHDDIRRPTRPGPVHRDPVLRRPHAGRHGGGARAWPSAPGGGGAVRNFQKHPLAPSE